MIDTAPSILTPWSNFYVIAGSSAGALTGLMFVVITLIADRRAQSTMQAEVFARPSRSVLPVSRRGRASAAAGR